LIFLNGKDYPFSMRDFYKLIQKNLIVFIYYNVLLYTNNFDDRLFTMCKKLTSPDLLKLFSFKLFLNIFCQSSNVFLSLYFFKFLLMQIKASIMMKGLKKWFLVDYNKLPFSVFFYLYVFFNVLRSLHF
jgi:hypothetical protein